MTDRQGEFEITAKKEEHGFVAHIVRVGRVRHFQIKGTFTRTHSLDVGPFDSADEAIAVAKAGIEEGWLEL